VKRLCVYCGGSKLTREHVVSRSVMQIALGPQLENIVRTDHTESLLIDHESVVKDLCESCNNQRLQPYETGGLELAKYLDDKADLTGLSIPFTVNTLGWLLKTHLNALRIFPRTFNSEKYQMDPVLMKGIIEHAIPLERFVLAVEGWEGAPSYWQKTSERKLSYFFHKSAEALSERIVVSDFRIKCFQTYFLFPVDHSPLNLVPRAGSVLRQMKSLNMNPVVIDVATIIKTGQLDIKRILSRAEIELLMKPLRPK
jgi:hypothetical protein